MLRLSDRTSPRRPRRLAPQVDALEDIISLSDLGLRPPVPVTTVITQQAATAVSSVDIKGYEANGAHVNSLAVIVQVSVVNTGSIRI